MTNNDFDVSEPWQKSNQAWWDWYVSLAFESKMPSELMNYVLPAELRPSSGFEETLATIDEEYRVDDSAIELFRKQGFLKLKNVFSGSEIAVLRQAIIKELLSFSSENPQAKKQKFLSLDMVWRSNLIVKKFVVNRRLAGIVGKLLGVPAVRLYHDNVLSKEPGCGRTPWHYDTHHFPICTPNVVTAWCPVQPIPIEMGPLIFASPLSAYKHVDKLRFNKNDNSYDKLVEKTFKENNIKIICEAYELGEVSFHHNLSFHCASPNMTKESRLVLANTYFEDGAKVVDSPTMVSGDWKKFIPDTAPNEVIRTSCNPICWKEN
jgi:ectoine hydroxylase-related dioxygenase (phytanoyl-CoA dioxygenase family)